MNELESPKVNTRITKALAISIISMLAAVVVSLQGFNNSSMLMVCYAIAFCIQTTAIIIAVPKNEWKVKHNDLCLLLIFVVIMIIPITRNAIVGIETNPFDYINIAIKAFNFLLFYVIVKRLVIDEEQIDIFMKIILLVFIVALIYSAIFDINDIMAIRSIRNTNAINVHSFFANRNQYSAFLSCAIVANIYLCHKTVKRWNVILFVLLAISILLTFSRGALLSTIVVIVLVFLRKARISTKIIVAVCIVALAIVLINATGFVNTVSTNYIRAENLDSGRFDIWKNAIRLSGESNFLGIGFYTAADIAFTHEIITKQFHSLFLDTLVGGGILELIFIISIMMSVFFKCKKSNMEEFYYAVYRASFIGFFIYAFFESMSLFSLSYGDTLCTVMYISLPLMMANSPKFKSSSTNAP